MADILTKENSALNEIDFFDSDDLKKSPAGVIAKNVALIAPMFTPAAPYYYTALIAKELTTTLPMLYNMLNNTFLNVVMSLEFADSEKSRTFALCFSQYQI